MASNKEVRKSDSLRISFDSTVLSDKNPYGPFYNPSLS